MSLRRFGAVALVAAAVTTYPLRASAFCRTITEQIPADFDQTKACYDPPGAIPLWWANACVGFSIQQNASKQITLADAETHTKTAFERWSAAACASGGSPSIKAVDEGPVACNLVQYSEAGPNQHVIIFHDDKWPYNDVYNTLALTTVTFDTDTGELFDADMEINSASNTIVVNTTPTSGAYDYDSIVTHEAGHFLGLAHSPLETAVMYAFYKPGSTKLSTDDVSGICTAYAPDGTRATERDAGAGSGVQEVKVAASACDPTPRHGFGSQCGPVGPVSPIIPRSCSVGAARGSSGGGDGPAFALATMLGALAVARRRGAKLAGMRSARVAVMGLALGLCAGAGSDLFAERDAQASVSITVLFDELVRDSSAAVVVTPIEQRSVWENGRVMTYTHLRVDQSVAGSIAGDPWVRTMGGVVGKIGQLVEGEAVLTVGKQGLLFVQPLSELGPAIYAVTARAQGQFPVVADEAGAQRFVQASGVGGLVNTPATRVGQISKMRAAAGLSPTAPLASEVLHRRPIAEGTREIASAWVRLHGAK